MNNCCCRLSAETFCQANGCLSVIEGDRTLPFLVQRCFFLYNLKPGDVRGKHAVKNEQCLFLLSGECSVMVHDGKEKVIYKLKTPMEGLYIPYMFWREVFDCSSNCLLAVFSDQHYDPNAYVRNFDSFLKYWATDINTKCE